jgi:hypothetical protein
MLQAKAILDRISGIAGDLKLANLKNQRWTIWPSSNRRWRNGVKCARTKKASAGVSV